ncbi:Energy conserving hydrogenase Eha protein M [Methanocaldococcus lauensis]|nr:Energy conserving hydrogenase Eha protein M [Methanocaldococcus lauensis]
MEETLNIDKKYVENSLKQKINVLKDNRFLMDEVFIPISKALKIDVDEVIEIFLKKLDFTSCYELHAYAEQARMGCLGRKVDIDLGLCWLCDFFGLIKKEEADLIRKKVVELHVLYKKPYEEALEEGRKLIIKLLKEE